MFQNQATLKALNLQNLKTIFRSISSGTLLKSACWKIELEDEPYHHILVIFQTGVASIMQMDGQKAQPHDKEFLTNIRMQVLSIFFETDFSVNTANADEIFLSRCILHRT